MLRNCITQWPYNLYTNDEYWAYELYVKFHQWEPLTSQFLNTRVSSSAHMTEQTHVLTERMEFSICNSRRLNIINNTKKKQNLTWLLFLAATYDIQDITRHAKIKHQVKSTLTSRSTDLSSSYVSPRSGLNGLLSRSQFDAVADIAKAVTSYTKLQQTLNKVTANSLQIHVTNNHLLV